MLPDFILAAALAHLRHSRTHAGLPGIKPFGEEDKCTGPDDDGVKRNGRKKGPERKFGAAAGEACSE